MIFVYPWILPVPLLIIATLFWRKRPSPAILHGNCAFLGEIRVSTKVRLRKPLLISLALSALFSLTIAAARPQRVTTIVQDHQARNIMLVLDLSRSMETDDFKAGTHYTSRIEAVKAVVREFVQARHRDRLGLVIFGSSAFLQSPLTFDTNLIKTLVEGLQLRIAGDATAMGDGIGVALKALQDLPAVSSAIILLTDGVSNSGQVNPIKAAQVSADLGIRIHTIGIGTKQPLVKPGGSFFDLRPTVIPEFDEKTLRKIAELTGGVYFSADSVAGLKQVYHEIDQLELSEHKNPELRQNEELFPPFLYSAIGFLLLYYLLANSVFLKLP